MPIHNASDYSYGIGGWHSHEMSFSELIEANSDTAITAKCLFLKQVIQKHGITPSIIKQVVEGAIAIAPGCNIEPYYSTRFQGIVVGAWSDLEDIISSYGNRMMQVAYDALNGNSDRDFYYEVSENEIEDFLNRLEQRSAKAFAEAWQFLKLNVGLPQVQNAMEAHDDSYSEEGIDESTPLADIARALMEEGEETLWNAADMAVRIGNENGAEAEMSEDFHKALRRPNEDVPGTLVTFKKDKWYDQRISKKDPKQPKPHIFHVIGVTEMLDVIKEGLGSEDNFVDASLPYERSSRENKSWLNLDEPNYGWSGFDDDSAISIFMEEIPPPPRINGSGGNQENPSV